MLKLWVEIRALKREVPDEEMDEVRERAETEVPEGEFFKLLFQHRAHISDGQYAHTPEQVAKAIFPLIAEMQADNKLRDAHVRSSNFEARKYFDQDGLLVVGIENHGVFFLRDGALLEPPEGCAINNSGTVTVTYEEDRLAGEAKTVRVCQKFKIRDELWPQVVLNPELAAITRELDEMFEESATKPLSALISDDGPVGALAMQIQGALVIISYRLKRLIVNGPKTTT